MLTKKIAVSRDKKIALVAHDNKKQDLVAWAKFNRTLLAHHQIYATGATGAILERELGLNITKLQGGAKIADGEIDFMIFFSDPLEARSPDPDIKVLLRLAIELDIPIACNRASADFMISSPLMDGDFNAVYPLHLTKLLSKQG